MAAGCGSTGTAVLQGTVTLRDEDLDDTIKEMVNGLLLQGNFGAPGARAFCE